MTASNENDVQITADLSTSRISNLTIQELNMLILKLEEETSQLQGLSSALTIALERFQESKRALVELDKRNENIQVPLTSLVYVPGKLNNPDKVLVSIGTGYYVEMAIKHANEYYERRIRTIDEQMCKLQGMISGKSKQINLYYSHLDQKLAMMRSAQTAGSS
ncbi:prefoldin alpha subunit, putative [Theileria equi strain WA]|uniref:Prefoldin alpha subunit, putative n=1 Tax=Theileria equi strain WA TaxID=1537102 RepID=L0AY58_THEEQ|nr:prefoldin alpha subunit, putative [Theileria equi strain WA]AFZ80517.1 prefoldin alpha subunit, putative [Theileria equi strain WA]|eukprot:XP_004830183.1 prefoldin alpha subunit, putative [Theileria equi strain WA]